MRSMMSSSPTAAVIGGADQILSEAQLQAFVGAQLTGQDLDGASVCLIVPDATRSCPLPELLKAVYQALVGRVSRLTVLIALGTHAPMNEERLARHLGYTPGALDQTYPGLRVLNHEWAEPKSFLSLGSIPATRVAELSEGRLVQKVDVRLNRAVIEHDVAMVVGPVFPHEVVGFSGGNKYFFPGVAGPEIIDVSHWLGALITSADIIGTRGITPVRALIDEAASMIPSRRLALCVVVRSGGSDVHAAAFGDPQQAWAAAADVSAQTHVRYLEKPVQRVLSIIPRKYDDIWTAAKGFYKLEPVVADGGEVVLYAPHITQIAATHPEIEQIGYHCRDYFTGQWDRFRNIHWGVMAHSTHLRGAGTWNTTDGERCRVKVTLATSIPEDLVRRVNLDHLNPEDIDLQAWRSDEDALVVPDAGEILFRVRTAVDSRRTSSTGSTVG